MNKNKHLSLKALTFCIIILLLAYAKDLRSEIIVLKDGQKINGTIVRRGKRFIIVRTPYQKRRIALYDVAAIEKEQNDLQKIYIFTRDRYVIKGYLVEQDSLEIKYKKDKDSADEETISKLDVLRMSNKEIRPADLEFGLRIGALYPMNSGNSELKTSPVFMGTVGASSMYIRNLRIVFDAGYSRSENSQTSDRYLQIIPVTLSAEYRFVLPWRFMEISPRIGLGVSMTEYSDGEGDEYSGTIPAVVTGFRLSYPVIRHRLYAGTYADYFMLYDGSGLLHSMTGGISVAYRL